LVVGEQGGAGALGAVVVVLGVGEVAQLRVPVGLQGVGDESVGGVDREVAAAGRVGGVLGALDVGGADAVGVFGALDELGADLQRGLECPVSRNETDRVGIGVWLLLLARL
jgi:hypothetical protein